MLKPESLHADCGSTDMPQGVSPEGPAKPLKGDPAVPAACLGGSH